MSHLGWNSSSHAAEDEFLHELETAQELMDQMGLIKCADKSCKQEMLDLGIESAVIAYSPESTKPVGMASTVTVSSFPIVTSVGQANPTRSVASLNLPMMTPSPTKGR